MPRRNVPGGRLEAELARLAGMDAARLAAAWRRVFGRAAPPGLSQALVHRALAYRVQANALGDLHRETVRVLDSLRHSDGAVIPLPEPRTQPGTLLTREWQGVLQSVTVLEEGFAWNGQTYDSLTKVAHAITGTKWNGPRFFGLRGTGSGISGRAR